jgi:hypothetical protein
MGCGASQSSLPAQRTASGENDAWENERERETGKRMNRFAFDDGSPPPKSDVLATAEGKCRSERICG